MEKAEWEVNPEETLNYLHREAELRVQDQVWENANESLPAFLEFLNRRRESDSVKLIEASGYSRKTAIFAIAHGFLASPDQIGMYDEFIEKMPLPKKAEVEMAYALVALVTKHRNRAKLRNLLRD